LHNKRKVFYLVVLGIAVTVATLVVDDQWNVIHDDDLIMSGRFGHDVNRSLAGKTGPRVPRLHVRNK